VKRNLPITRLRTAVTYYLLILFALNVISVLAIIFFVGFGKMTLSDKLILTMIGSTVAQAASVLVMVTRFIFPVRRARCEATNKSERTALQTSGE
jgi:hypothetical protein